MTNTNPHMVFQQPHDKFDWDKYLEQLELIELSEVQRKRGRAAIQFLREMFGEKFLKRASFKDHPIYRELLNAAPLARLRLIGFAESLRLFERAEGYSGLVARLKKAVSFSEALTVLETAAKFQRASLTVSFDPVVEVTATSGKKTLKMPDIKLVNPQTQEEIFVEVSRLRQSDQQIKSANTFYAIYFLISQIRDDSLIIEEDRENNRQIQHFILPYANILRHLEDSEIAEIIPQIQDLAVTARETNKFQELVIEGTIEVVIAPYRDHHTVEEWALARGLRGQVQSPPIPLDEIHRTRIKIGDKIRQLPPGKPGIVVIPTSETLLLLAYPPEKVIEDIKTEIQQYPHLLYAVLSLQIGEGQINVPLTASLGDDWLTKKTGEDFTTETKVIMKNSTYNLPVSKSTVKMINQALKE